MAKLFLTSYLAGTKRFLNAFLGNQLEKEVNFIPTAANVEEYKEYVEEAKLTFEELGFQVNIVDIAQMNRDDILSVLNKVDCLYVSGGNTFYLLQELKRKELIEPIRNRVSEGMLYIGESAGAVITSKNIDYVQDMDDKTIASDLTDSSGLSLVDFYVVPHINEFPFEESAAQVINAYEKTLNLLPINNSEVIIVDNNKVRIMK